VIVYVCVCVCLLFKFFHQCFIVFTDLLAKFIPRHFVYFGLIVSVNRIVFLISFFIIHLLICAYIVWPISPLCPESLP
jgi:hypothetical protein